jgi:hypothetical protein
LALFFPEWWPLQNGRWHSEKRNSGYFDWNLHLEASTLASQSLAARHAHPPASVLVLKLKLFRQTLVKTKSV